VCRIGQNPWQIVPQALRMKYESTNPVLIDGSRVAPGSCSARNDAHAAYSGVSMPESEPPVGGSG
jgi:hypothetical protein